MVATFLALTVAAMVDPGYSNFWDASTLSRSVYGPAGLNDLHPALLRTPGDADFAHAVEDEQDDTGQQARARIGPAEDRDQSLLAARSSKRAGWFEFVWAGMDTGAAFAQLAGNTFWGLFSEPYVSFPDEEITYIERSSLTFSTFNNLSGGILPGRSLGFGGGRDAGKARDVKAAAYGADNNALTADSAALDGSQPNHMAEEQTLQFSPSAPAPPWSPNPQLPARPFAVDHPVEFILLIAFVAGLLGAARRSRQIPASFYRRAAPVRGELLL
jgi:hypothetical protein